jgi:hypothetical protein
MNTTFSNSPDAANNPARRYCVRRRNYCVRRLLPVAETSALSLREACGVFADAPGECRQGPAAVGQEEPLIWVPLEQAGVHAVGDVACGVERKLDDRAGPAESQDGCHRQLIGTKVPRSWSLHLLDRRCSSGPVNARIRLAARLDYFPRGWRVCRCSGRAFGLWRAAGRSGRS